MEMEFNATLANWPGVNRYAVATETDLESLLNMPMPNCIDPRKVTCNYGTPAIKKVIFNNPATIVIWTDDVKTVVKCGEGDAFDPEKGLAMAISKRFFGNKGNYCNIFKKWVPEQLKQPDKSDEEKRIREKVIDYIDKTIREIEKGREVEDAEDDDDRW